MASSDRGPLPEDHAAGESPRAENPPAAEGPAERESAVRSPLAPRISEQHFALAFRCSPTPLVISRVADGLIYEVNERWESFTGFSRAESIGHTTVELKVYAESDGRDRLVEGLRRDGRVRDLELMLRTATHETHTILLTAEPIDLNGEACLLASLQDVTEQRAAEARSLEHLATLAHMERLVTVGELAAGLAHELNQPLSSIRIQTDLAIAALPARADTESSRKAMLLVIEQAQRATSIIQMLRSLVRKGELRRSTVDLNAMVVSTLSLIESAARQQGVSLSRRLCGETPLVLGDRIQLSQALLNLLHNALQAVEGQPPARRWVEVSTAAEDQYVLLTVHDRGVGFQSDAAARLFDAFFTTRGDGLGLGLAISKSIIEAHHGQIRGTTNDEGGATFVVALPRIDH